MRLKGLVLITAGALLLQGCATLNESECVTSDWYAIGYEDGARGFAAEQIGKHRKACAKHGVTPDLGSYQAGRDQGLREFCQPEKGFNLGARGGGYNGVCPSDLEYEFVEAYREGKHLYQLESSVRAANSHISNRKSELEDVKEEITTKEAALVSDDTTSEERIQLLAETRELSERKGQLEAEILDWEREKVRRSEQLAAYRATLYRY